MEISQFTDYSLRVLLYISARDDGLTSVKDVADAFDISRNHLVKVVHNLSKLGYLKTFRGRQGGIALAKSAEDVGIGELVRTTENLALVECFPQGRGKCCIAGVCELQLVFGKALQAFLAELDKVSLADLMNGKHLMLRRLGISKTS